MNREILFRGFHERSDGDIVIVVNGEQKRGKWKYGLPHRRPASDKKTNSILCEDYYGNEMGLCLGHTESIIPETLGQYTGLTDKNGIRIFEGDVVRHGHRCIYSGGQYKDFYDNLPIAFSINFGGWIIGEHNILTVKNVKKYSIEVISTIYDKENT